MRPEVAGGEEVERLVGGHLGVEPLRQEGSVAVRVVVQAVLNDHGQSVHFYNLTKSKFRKHENKIMSGQAPKFHRIQKKTELKNPLDVCEIFSTSKIKQKWQS